MYDANKAGKIVIAADTVVNVRQLPASSSQLIAAVKKGQPIGRSSGSITNMPNDGGDWIQVNLYAPINGNSYGYVKAVYNGKDNVDLIEPPDNASPVAEENGQKLADSIVENDKKTFMHLVRCYKYYAAMKKRNKPVPASIVNSFAQVYGSLAIRQEKMKQISGTQYKTGKYNDPTTVNGMTQLWLNSRSNMHGIGWVQLVVLIIVFIVGAASAVAVYYTLKPDYTDSERDLKISKELEDALSKLSPEDRKKVEEDLNKQIDDSYNAGKTDQFFSGIGKNLKWGLLIVAGVLVGKKVFGKNGGNK